MQLSTFPPQYLALKSYVMTVYVYVEADPSSAKDSFLSLSLLAPVIGKRHELERS